MILTFRIRLIILYLDSRLNIIRMEEVSWEFKKHSKHSQTAPGREILELLKEGAVSAGDIAAHFHMTAATISHHLAVLKAAELVSDEKRGKFVYYELNMSVIDDIIRWMTAFQGGNPNEK